MRKLFVVLLTIIMIISLAACNNDVTKPTEPETPTIDNTIEPSVDLSTEPVETTPVMHPEPEGTKSAVFIVGEENWEKELFIEVSNEKPEETALTFLLAIATHRYDVVLQLLDIRYSEFVTEQDIKNNMSNSAYDTLVEYAGKNCYVLVRPDSMTRTNNTAAVVISLMNEYNAEVLSCTINMNMDADNRWVVSDEVFYEYNFSFVVPPNAEVYIDNILVDRERYCIEQTDDGSDMYCIGRIGKSTKKIKIVSEGFEKELEYMPVANFNDPIIIN